MHLDNTPFCVLESKRFAILVHTILKRNLRTVTGSSYKAAERLAAMPYYD